MPRPAVPAATSPARSGQPGNRAFTLMLVAMFALALSVVGTLRLVHPPGSASAAQTAR
ncbi:MAG: hypothetical protein QM656_12540 [Paracoccaceae bacterium]